MARLPSELIFLIGCLIYATERQHANKTVTHVAFKWMHLNDNVHASIQGVPATFAHAIGYAAL